MKRRDAPAPTLTGLADELDGLEAEAKALSDREDELQAELDRVVSAYDATTERLKAARLRVVVAVLDRAGVAMPSTVDWHFNTAPVAVVREGSRSFMLAAIVSDDLVADLPNSPEKLAQRVALVIVPDDEPGRRIVE